MKVTVSWKSRGKTVTVDMDCDTSLQGWEEKCAAEVKKAVDAMLKKFPEDKESQHD